MPSTPANAFPFKGSDNNAYTGQTLPLSNGGQVANDTVVQAASTSRSGLSTIKAVSATVVSLGTGYAFADTITDTAGVWAVSAIKAVSASIAAGGSGYAANDTITNAAGTWTVTTVSSGAVTAVTPASPSTLTSAASSNPLAQTATSGSGTGCTLTVAYGAASITLSTANALTSTPANPLAQSSTSGSGTGNTRSIAYTPAALTIAPSNTGRRGIAIQNQSNQNLYFSLVGTATPDQNSFLLGPGDAYESPSHHVGTGAISLIGLAAGQAFYAREF